MPDTASSAATAVDERLVVARDGTRLATRTYNPGGRTDALFLHGAGSNLEAVALLAQELAGYGVRVVTIDDRWSGQSGGGGAFAWDVMLDDMSDVIIALGLRTPVVLGHSLGGVAAVLFAAARDGCAAVVNIDGHLVSPHDLEDDHGDAEGDFRNWLSRASGWLDGQRFEGDVEWAEAAIARDVEGWVAADEPRAFAEANVRRMFRTNGGVVERRPGRAFFETFASDPPPMFDVYERVPCPALVVRCTVRGEGSDEFLLRWRVARDAKWARLSVTAPNVSVIEVAFTHGSVCRAGVPSTIAAVVGFLRDRTTVDVSEQGRSRSPK